MLILKKKKIIFQRQSAVTIVDINFNWECENLCKKYAKIKKKIPSSDKNKAQVLLCGKI